MSARNSHEAKAERRDEREARAAQQEYMAEYMAAVGFALQAERSTRAVPRESLERSIAHGDALIVPGIDLDMALEVEHGQRALRALLIYRYALEGERVTLHVVVKDDGNSQQAEESVDSVWLSEERAQARVAELDGAHRTARVEHHNLNGAV